MKQLPLSLEGSWLRTYQQISNFERRYHTVVIENAGEWTENAVNVFSKHGSDMRCLELTDCSLEIRQAELFNRLFKLCKKMETLKLNNVDLDVYEASELNAMKSLDLPCLKRVVLNESSLAVSLKCINFDCRIYFATLCNFRYSNSSKHRNSSALKSTLTHQI